MTSKNNMASRGRYTAVVYVKKRVKRVVIYVHGDGRPLVVTVPASREIKGMVVKRWKVGNNTEAYTVRMRAIDVVQLIDTYAYDAARRKMHIFDPIYREAARQGYKVHDNELYVKLWLDAPLGAELFPIGDIRERELGKCIRGFTHSFGVWRMVTPPWAATC